MTSTSDPIGDPAARPARVRRGSGFSLTELLIIVLTAIVLAVIGVLVYSSAQQGVADARAKANVSAAVDAIGRFAFAHDGTLPTVTEFIDGSVEFPNVASGEPGFVLYSVSDDATRFCVYATGDGDRVFVADNKLAATVGTCADGIATAVATSPTPSGDVIRDL